MGDELLYLACLTGHIFVPVHKSIFVALKVHIKYIQRAEYKIKTGVVFWCQSSCAYFSKGALWLLLFNTSHTYLAAGKPKTVSYCAVLVHSRYNMSQQRY